MDTQLTLAQAMDGFLFFRKAAGKSRHTLRDYRNTFAKLLLYIPGDTPVASITRSQIVAFFAWLQNEYVSEPGGFAPRGQIKLSAKSVKNIHTNLAAFWTWALGEEFVAENIVKRVDKPEAPEPVIEAFTREEIEAMIKACSRRAHTWKTRGGNSHIADRDMAIIRVLLDTGVRASELIGMTIDDLDLNTNSIRVKGKGGKERDVQIGRRTAKALWRYLAPRLETAGPKEPIFLVGWPGDPRPFTRRHLTTTLKRIGKRAGVKNVHLHKFRHTFSITYLRAGGDVYTLLLVCRRQPGRVRPGL